MTDLKLRTSEATLEALKLATRELTPEERHRQRVSFIMGSLKPESTVTREQVESMLGRSHGSRAAA
jgi:hypothetical protein